MNVADVINEMRRLGKDTGDNVWSEAEKLAFTNRAAKLLCQMKPNIHTSREEVTCLAGPLQNVPPGMRFLSVVGTLNGSTVTRAITPVDEAELTGYLPEWRALTAVDEPDHYLFNPAKPDTFELYPPVNAGVLVQVMAETFPADMLENDDLPFDQIYFEPLCLTSTALMLYENEPDLALVGHYLDRVSQMLGLKVEVERAVSTD